MRIRALAIISSPFQLINLKEFIETQKNISCYIVGLYFNQEDKRRITNVANSLDIVIDKKIKRRKVRTYLRLIPLVFWKKYDQLIIGHYYDNTMVFFSNLLIVKKIIVLDDGFATLTSLRIYRGKKKSIFGNRNYYFQKKRINFFTIFHDNNPADEIINHNFLFLSRKLKIFEITQDIFFIGQPLFNYISKSDYHHYLKYILDSNPGKKIKYIPHRFEKASDLLEYEKVGFEILKTEIPIECFLITSNLIPSKIIGICSTSLFTISILFKNCDLPVLIESIKLPDSVIDYNLHISQVYDLLKNNIVLKDINLI
jgi:hypothetical protein